MTRTNEAPRTVDTLTDEEFAAECYELEMAEMDEMDDEDY